MSVSGLIVLAQAGDGGGLFTNLLLLTIVFIFGSAIVGAVMASRKRDRCLALLDDQHVTMALSDGAVVWGALRVFAHGIEIEYDAPSTSQHGFVKSSYLLYQPEMGGVVAFCRFVGHLTEDEQQRRLRQVEARFRPGRLRRMWRSIRNSFNTVRDAFTKAMNAFIGQMGKVGGKASVAGTQKGELQKIGKSLISEVGYAYEPMLERHIGRPVVIEMMTPTDDDATTVELHGYLAEYSDKYLAVFSVEQPVHETLTLPGDESTDRDDLKIVVDSSSVRVTNSSSIPLVVDALISDAGETRKLGVVLTRASSAQFPRIPGALSLRLHRLQRIDVVCHRSRAVIRHASIDGPSPDGPKN